MQAAVDVVAVLETVACRNRAHSEMAYCYSALDRPPLSKGANIRFLSAPESGDGIQAALSQLLSRLLNESL